MTDIHKGLEGKRFKVPSDIKKVSICKDSGMLAGEHCSEDPRGSRVYTEVYVNGTQPSETCTVHVKAKVCEEDGLVLLANENCPNAVERVFITREDSDKDDNWKKGADAKYMLPTETCTKHTKPAEPEKPKEENTVNQVTNSVKNEVRNTTNTTNSVEDKNSVTTNTTNTTTNTTTNSVTNTTTNTTENKVENSVPVSTDVENAVKNVVNSVSGATNQVVH